MPVERSTRVSKSLCEYQTEVEAIDGSQKLQGCRRGPSNKRNEVSVLCSSAEIERNVSAPPLRLGSSQQRRDHDRWLLVEF